MISSSRIRQKSRLRAGYNSDLYTLSNELVKRDTRIRKQEEPGRIYRNVLKRLKSRIARVAARWWIIHRDEEGGGIVRFEDKSQGEAQDNPPPNYPPLFESQHVLDSLLSSLPVVRFCCLETVGFSAWISTQISRVLMFRVNRRDFAIASSRSLALPLLIAAFRVYFTFPSLFRADLMLANVWRGSFKRGGYIYVRFGKQHEFCKNSVLIIFLFVSIFNVVYY